MDQCTEFTQNTPNLIFPFTSELNILTFGYFIDFACCFAMIAKEVPCKELRTRPSYLTIGSS